jgi:hypothetical protein
MTNLDGVFRREWGPAVSVNVVGSGIVGAGLNTFRSSGQPCMSVACVTWSYRSQEEPGGRPSERSQQQNGHDDVP